MQRSVQLLTRASLIKDAWHCKFIPGTSRINVHIGRLRANVDDPHEAPIIRNVRGKGYVLSETPALPTTYLDRGGSSRESRLKRILTTSNVRGPRFSLKRILTTSNVRVSRFSLNASSTTHTRLLSDDGNARRTSRGVRRRGQGLASLVQLTSHRRN
jgi:hypothetical protein